MLRTLWVILVAIADTLVFAPLTALLAMTRPGSPWIDRGIRRWAAIIVRAAGIRITLHHRERIEPHRQYIIIANHNSYFDIPCLQTSFPQPVRFFAKKSLFAIPIFGWSLKANGFIPIDRKNRRTAVASFDLAAQRIKRGNTIIIFPEEGRSRTGRMRPFQRGAFLLAMKSRLPIVPVAIRGTYEVMPATRFSVRPGPVDILIGEPIETEGISVRRRDEIVTRTRSIIAGMLGVEEPETAE